MELLTRTYRDLRRLLGANGWFTCGAVAILACLEIVGRRTTSDLHDLLSVFILAIWTGVAVAWHRQANLASVGFLQRLGKSFLSFLNRFAFEIGIDMRGKPPIPRGYPPAVTGTILVLLAWAGLLLLFRDAVPH